MELRKIVPKILKVCEVDDCQSYVKALNLCSKHWKRFKWHGDVNIVHQRGGANKIADFCTIEGCDNPFLAKGYCGKHYRRWTDYGDANYTKPKKQYPAKYIEVLATGHPNAKANGMILEHRLVMSEMIGRPLMPGENVHHKNGDGKDNRPENLELWNTAQPAGQRPSDKVEYAIMILNLYAPELLADNGELS